MKCYALHIQAVLRRPVESGQYAAGDYRKVLKARGITVSMSRKGDCWDNAPMESANGTFKVECVHGEHFRTRAEAEQALIEYIGYYNTERRHSSLGNLSPAEFERRWHARVPPSSPAVASAQPRLPSADGGDDRTPDAMYCGTGETRKAA